MRNYIKWPVVMLAVLAFAACGGSGSGGETVRLFGTTNPSGEDSVLVMLSPEDGSFMSTVGTIDGFRITGLEYDASRDVLYGTSNSDDFLVIDMATGAATALSPGPETQVTRPTVDSTGFMVAWSPEDSGDDSLVVIDTATGEATEVGDFGFSFIYEHGLAFDNEDNLYIIDNNGETSIIGYFGQTTYVGSFGTRAHHGDFHPETGYYWGIDDTNMSGDGQTRHLLVVDVNTPAVMDSLATVDYLSAVTFYYD